MRTPYLFLGKAGGGKDYLVATHIGLFEESDILIIDHYEAERITNFLKDGKVIKILVIKEVPDEKKLHQINNNLIGLARGLGYAPRVMYTSNSIDTVSPLPEFHKIICSHHLYADKFQSH